MASTSEPMIDMYFDCAGRKRRFRLELVAEGLFLEAFEMRDDEREGLRFIMAVRDGELPPYGQMRDLIRERLSQRDLIRNPETRRLENTRRTVRAQIHSGPEGTDPTLIVDDLQLTWRELGQVLARYGGFGLRLEICECGEE
jgi:hypothetical protein